MTQEDKQTADTQLKRYNLQDFPKNKKTHLWRCVLCAESLHPGWFFFFVCSVLGIFLASASGCVVPRCVSRIQEEATATQS